MHKLFIPILAAASAFPTAVNAGVDFEVHNLCKDLKGKVQITLEK